jgi:hypothetical protein
MATLRRHTSSSSDGDPPCQETTILHLNVRPIEGGQMVYDSSAKVYDLTAIDTGRKSFPEPLTAVWEREIKRRTDGNDARWIDVVVSKIVVALDMIEVNGLGDTRLLIKI